MKFIIFILLVMVSFVQAQTGEKETLQQINQQVVAAYNAKKYDEAIKFGQQAVDLSLKIYGLQNRETAVSYTNLGVIYRDKGKFKDAVKNLQKAVEIYESIPNFKNVVQITAYETLALIQILDNSEKEAELNYLKAIEVAEEKFGKESKEVFSPMFSLGMFYSRSKKFDKADEFYLKSYSLAFKNFGNDAEQLTQIEDSRICLTGPSFSKERDKIFEAATKKIIKGSDNDETELGVKNSIINGKAKSLPKPEYPFEARKDRLGGTIAVRVTIDEQGNVTEAKAVCGHPILEKASEEAARKAKFSPTILAGEPVSVTGIIVYNFVP